MLRKWIAITLIFLTACSKDVSEPKVDSTIFEEIIEPTISFEDIRLQDGFMSYSLDINDPSEIGELSVELLYRNQIVSSSSEVEGIFTVDSNRVYKLKVSYQYEIDTLKKIEIIKYVEVNEDLNDITEDILPVYQWFDLVRLENGLHKSAIPGQVISLYDNALAAITYTMMGDYNHAEAIFDFFDSRIETELNDKYGGFVQIRELSGDFYGIGNRWLGDNAWLLVALNYYKYETGSTKYSNLENQLETWIISLQNEDGSLNSGIDYNGNMMYPVTEGMIDAYNAVEGFDDFHIGILSYFEETRYDSEHSVLLAWPGNPDYAYSLDTIGWAYLAMDDWNKEILSVADTKFKLTVDDLTGYCTDEDKDAIFSELSLTMAVAYNHAEEYGKANEIIQNMEKMLIQIDDVKGLPYTNQMATGYGNQLLWDTVETDPHLSGNAWYIFSKLRLNPYEEGLNKQDYPKFYE